MVSAGPSIGARRQLDLLARAQPESGPWLALATEAAREAGEPGWKQAADDTVLQPDQSSPAPILTGERVTLDRSFAEGWFRRLLAQAGNAGPAAAPLASAAKGGRLDAVALLEAAVNQDAPRLTEQAGALGVDADALSAVSQLATVPLLQACRQRFAAAVPGDWSEGCCPVCGAWPTVAESRGLARARHLRCARCGADWGAIAFRCPYCGNADHRQLGSLISETEGEARRVDTCDRCRGYVKTVATLRAWAADEVALADVATVDLDLAAIERDYFRPEASAVDLRLQVIEPASTPLGAR